MKGRCKFNPHDRVTAVWMDLTVHRYVVVAINTFDGTFYGYNNTGILCCASIALVSSVEVAGTWDPNT